MIEKKLSLIITFPSTTGAMKAEDCLKRNSCEGRLIPVPRDVTASCGLAWKAKIESEIYIREVIEKNNLKYEKMLHLEC